jgi:hypothetical protein
MRLTRIQVAARSGTLTLTPMLAVTLGAAVETPTLAVLVTLGAAAVTMPAAVVEVMVAIRRAACKYTPSLTATMHCTCIIIIIKPQAWMPS